MRFSRANSDEERCENGRAIVSKLVGPSKLRYAKFRID